MASTSFARLGDELWQAATSIEEIVCRMESFEHIYHRLQDAVEGATERGHPADRNDTAAICTMSTLRFLENKKLDDQCARVYQLARLAIEAGAATDSDTPSVGRVDRQRPPEAAAR